MIMEKILHHGTDDSYVSIELAFNPLNAKLNPICHLLAMLGAHPILHVSRIRLKNSVKPPSIMSGRTDFCQTQVGRCLHSISAEDMDRFNLRNAGYFMNIRR